MEIHDKLVNKKVVNIIHTIQIEDNDMSISMNMYIQELRIRDSKCKIKAKSNARAALRRTGVINSKGKTRKKIVSWE